MVYDWTCTSFWYLESNRAVFAGAPGDIFRGPGSEKTREYQYFQKLLQDLPPFGWTLMCSFRVQCVNGFIENTSDSLFFCSIKPLPRAGESIRMWFPHASNTKELFATGSACSVKMPSGLAGGRGQTDGRFGIECVHVVWLRRMWIDHLHVQTIGCHRHTV